MQPTNYLTLHSSRLASLQTSTLNVSTLTGSTIRASFLTLSTLTVSSINGALPGTGSNVSTNVSTWLTGTGGIIYYNGGNVGIGTSADISNFQVYGATNPNITLGNSTYPSDFQIGMASAGGNYSVSAIAGDTIIRTISGNLMLQAMGGGTAAIYLSKTNNYVGIGMATPSNLLTVAQLGTNYTSPVVVVDAGIPSNAIAGAPRGIGKPLLGIGNSSWTSGGVAGDYYGIGFGYGGAASGSYYPAEIGLYVQTTSGATWGDIVFSARGVTSATVAVERMRITGGGNVGIGTNAPAGRITSYTTSADHTAAPDGTPTNHQLIIANSKSGTTPYAMAIGMDQTYGCGYINAAGNGAYQPVCLQTRGGSVGIGITNPGASYALHVVGAIFASGDITAFSDQRYKQNIVRLDRSLDKIRSLSGYSYTRQDYRPGERQIGLLAQEVKAVLPEAVSYDSANDKYSVNYNCLMAPVVEAIKELSDRVEAQQAIIRDQQAAIRDQQSVIQKLLDRLGPE